MIYQLIVKVVEKRMSDFLHMWLSISVLVLVLFLGFIQIQIYVINPSTKRKRMPIEVFVFYIMIYFCASLYFFLNILVGHFNG